MIVKYTVDVVSIYNNYPLRVLVHVYGEFMVCILI